MSGSRFVGGISCTYSDSRNYDHPYPAAMMGNSGSTNALLIQTSFGGTGSSYQLTGSTAVNIIDKVTEI